MSASPTRDSQLSATPPSASEQARALAQRAGVRLRDDLGLTRMRGEDARSWLNGQVTADVRAPAPGSAVYALAVTVRGKIMADLWVLSRQDELAVLLPHGATQTVLESFEHQIIMDDVELTPDPAHRVISVQGPLATQVIDAAALTGVERHRADELGHGGELVLLAETEVAQAFSRLTAAARSMGGCAVDDAGFELARLRAGRPRFGVDFDASHYPQEAGLEARAVSFNKGCYLGQEVICTLESRGRLSRRLARLAAPAGTPLAAGVELEDAEGRPVGRVTSALFDPDAQRVLALGYVKQALLAAGTLRAGGASIELLGAC